MKRVIVVKLKALKMNLKVSGKAESVKDESES